MDIVYLQDFPAGPVTNIPRSQSRVPKFDPWSGNKTPQATVKSAYATTKDPTCLNEGWRSRVSPLRSSAAK